MPRLPKIIYIVLFITILAMPHFSRHVGVISQPYVESIVMLIIFGIVYLTYYLSKQELKKKQEKIVASFQYIGVVNRKLPLLQNLTTDLIANDTYTKKEKKRIFYNLLATAVVSIAKAEWGVLRIMEKTSQRILKEFTLGDKSPKFENHAIITTLDQQASFQTFLILPKDRVVLTKEYSTLQAITDQAQLFFKYLYI